MSPSSHLNYSTPTKSNLYPSNSLAAAVCEPALFRLLTFQVPNLMPLFRCLGRTRVSVQVWGFPYEYFVTIYVFMVRSCSTSPNPQAGGPLLVGCPRLLIQYIRSYTPYWRPFLHLHPEARHAVLTGTHLSRLFCMMHLLNTDLTKSVAVNPDESFLTRMFQIR